MGPVIASLRAGARCVGRMPASFEITSSASFNGMHFALARRGEQCWRVGATRDDWPDFLEDLISGQSTAADGVWLRRILPRPPWLTAMCCGLGSVWPGMGRSLYAEFPVCAQAMDEVARLASWDLLGLMDEGGLEKITQTRWQIPYLFMLEYAQWRLLRSLGLQPDVFCGHSLGELIALCLAGVYSLEAAWYLLETRADHMAELEAMGRRSKGMLAVPADYAEIAPLLEQWPELRISNRNSMRQYILGGDREQLLAARRQLRRKKIPAIMLNMDLAFHNPAMRILRSISFRRLTGLVMGKSDAPVLSCVDGQPYPPEKEAICLRIADLDENTVDWVNLVAILQHDYPEGVLLELGPQETLCGLNHELAPDCLCLPVDRKGHEAQAMREACARLFALGLFRLEAITVLAGEAAAHGHYPAYLPAAPQEPDARAALADIEPEQRQTVMDLVAEAAGIPVAEVRPEMDLRQDLAVRSSHFPFLMLEAERRLGKQALLENLFRITTVADLIRFLTGAGEARLAAAQDGPRELFMLARRPWQRFVWTEEAGLEPLGLDPASARASEDACVYASVEDPQLAPYILGSLERLGLQLRGQEQLAGAGTGRALFVLPPVALDDAAAGHAIAMPQLPAGFKGIVHVARRLLATSCDWRQPLANWLSRLQKQGGYQPGIRNIILVDSVPPTQNWNEGADLLAFELVCGGEGAVVWNRLASPGSAPALCPASRIFDHVRPEAWPAGNGDGSVFTGACQYSCFARPALCAHGANAVFSPLDQRGESGNRGAAWLPPGLLLGSLCEAAMISAPGFMPIGFTDVRFLRFEAIRPGITRECRLSVSSRIGLNMEGVDARPAQASMAVAALAPNGRKSGIWLPLAEARCMLGAKAAPVPPVWQPGGEEGLPVADAWLAMFYQTLGMGAPWRMLGCLRANAAHAGVAADVALGNEPASRVFLLLDAALQGAMACLGLEAADPADLARKLSRWRFRGMGFIRVDAALPRHPGQSARMEWRLSWRDDNLLRYDAQAICGDRMILAIQNLEFDLAPAPGEAGQGESGLPDAMP